MRAQEAEVAQAEERAERAREAYKETCNNEAEMMQLLAPANIEQEQQKAKEQTIQEQRQTQQNATTADEAPGHNS